VRIKPSIQSLPIVTLIAFIASACQPTDTGPTPGSPVAGSLPAPTRAELENATYQDIQDHPLTLIRGRWQGEAFVEDGAARPGVGLVDDFYLAGDLDGDGAEEAVALLWSNSGGSGTFDYIVVVGRDDTGAPLHVATAALGDRVRIRAAMIDEGNIVVDVVQAGPDDPACCPGQKMKRRFELKGGALGEVESEDLGRQSIADLAGVEWDLQRFDRDDPVPDEIEVTLTFDGERIGGGSGCNRYSGGVAEGEVPGALTVDMPMASTMMACPPPAEAVERRYLARLQGVRQYSFLAGKLALSWRIDPLENGEDTAEFGTMIFTEKN
jgi:heat shock protein HslJ